MTVLVLLGALGLVAVVCGLGVFAVNSMARATFLLLASFVAVAVCLLVVGQTYLGVVVILMMTVEMMIMAVFMVMLMMNPGGLEAMTMVHNRGGSWAIALGVFAVLAAGAWLIPFPTMPAPAGDPTVALGDALMGPQMLTMTVLALALLAAIVGTVAVSVSRGEPR